eukprot:TRINITY_DN6568_c1_g2_i1.p1 TRINITY_DN6568_c1_g2~~TRINITY_DN6568_c1_g2_i1.p1  ORF type:complete len:649 (-),score=97.73 TRINITY_DN6568_c1_g2_i1:132-2078(-)
MALYCKAIVFLALFLQSVEGCILCIEGDEAEDIASMIQLPQTPSSGSGRRAVGVSHPQASKRPILVKLKRKRKRTETTSKLIQLEGGTSIAPWQGDSYVGNLYIGAPQPQHLEVIFDTASGQVVLPSSRCSSAACQVHNRYAPRASATSQDVNADGEPLRLQPGAVTVNRDAISIGVSSLDLGSGRISGDLIREQNVCFDSVDNKSCVDLGFVAATEMSDVPFMYAAYDGSVGLGLPALSLGTPFHLLSGLNQSKSTLHSTFGLVLGDHGGELALGGFNEEHFEGRSNPSALRWAPVTAPEEGYWQVVIRSIRIGNQTIACSSDTTPEKKCRGIIDSTASGIGFPDSKLESTLLELNLGKSGREKVLSSHCQKVPPLTFELQGVGSDTISLTLESKDYVDMQHCSPKIISTSLPEEEYANVFILGQPFLRRYYAAFDLQARKVGFAPVAANAFSGSREEERNPAALVPNVLSNAEAETLEAKVIAADARAVAAMATAAAMEAQSLSELAIVGFLVQAVVLLLVGFLRFQDTPQSRILLVRISSVAIAGLGGLGLKIPASWTPESMVTKIDASDAPEASDCVICLGAHEEGSTFSSCSCLLLGSKRRPKWCKLKCGHSFHEDCIFEWIWKARSCPVCRSDILENPKSKV